MNPFINFTNKLHQKKLSATVTGKKECADFQVPLTPDSDVNLTINVGRYALTPAPDAMVWHFAGGPGESSMSIFGSMLSKLAASYNADVYVMDIRGVGVNIGQLSKYIKLFDSSTPLNLQNVWDLYLDKFDKKLLPYANTDEDCRDVMAVINEEVRSKNQKIFLIGHSYGTFLVHRFVQIFPNVAESVLLDSTIAGPESKLLDWTLNGQWWYEYMGGLCSKNDFCHKKFGDDPKKFIRDLWIKLEGGWCSKSTDTSGVFDLKFLLILIGAPDVFQLSWVWMYRLNRCNAQDVKFLEKFNSNFDPSLFVIKWKYPSSSASRDSLASYYMKVNELGRFNIPTEDQIHGQLNNGILGDFSLSPTMYFYKAKNGTKNLWPWIKSPYDDKYAKSSTSFFLITGEIDYNTPLFMTDNLIKGLKGTNTAVDNVVIKGAGHVAGIANTCGNSILTEWVLNRGGKPDVSCVASLPEANWMVTSKTALGLGYSGNDDLYEYGQDTFSGSDLMWILIGCGIVLVFIIIVVVIVSVVNRSKRNKYLNLNETAKPL